MLRGERVVLRAVERDDVDQLELWNRDYETWPETHLEPYVAVARGTALKAYDEGKRWTPDERNAPFAVEADGGLVGSISLWGIDAHNRWGHLGITIGPEHRGKGYGSDACRVLLRHAFLDRGLHRVQLETLATNEPGLRAYRAAGFREEGRLRESAWLRGRFVDEVIMAVLATDPQAAPG